jgi:predicted RNA binding protein YcfA (HicA-like mRNA interferase family)
MSRVHKRLARLRRHPNTVRPEEVETLLLGLGFERRQRGTSHVVYSRGAHRLTIPYRKPFILPVYVRQILEVVDMIEESE